MLATHPLLAAARGCGVKAQNAFHYPDRGWMRRRKPGMWLPVTTVTPDIASLCEYLLSTGPMTVRDAARWLANDEEVGGKGGPAERINTLVRRSFLERVDWAPAVGTDSSRRDPSHSTIRVVGPGPAAIMHFHRRLSWDWSQWNVCCSVPTSRLLLRLKADVPWKPSGGDRLQGVMGRLQVGTRGVWVAALRYARPKREDGYKQRVATALRNLPPDERLWALVPDEAFLEMVTEVFLDAGVLNRALVVTDDDLWADRTVRLADAFRVFGDGGWERVRVSGLEGAERIQSVPLEEGIV